MPWGEGVHDISTSGGGHMGLVCQGGYIKYGKIEESTQGGYILEYELVGGGGLLIHGHGRKLMMMMMNDAVRP